MIFKRNWILLGVSLALLALGWLLEEPELEGAEDAALLPGATPSRVAGLRIAEPDPEGGPARTVTLTRGEDGWQVDDLGGFPAAAWSVDELVGRLCSLRTGSRVAREASSHGRYGVGEGGRRIELLGSGGERLGAVVQGEGPRADGGGRVEGSYVRTVEGDSVYRAPLLAPVQADPQAWISSRLMDFAVGEANGVTADWQSGGQRGQLALQLDGRVWRVVGAPAGAAGLPHTRVEAFLRLVASLYAAAVTPADASTSTGLDGEPWLRLAIQTSAGESARLVVGAPADAEHRYASSPDWREPWVVRLRSKGPEDVVAALESMGD